MNEKGEERRAGARCRDDVRRRVENGLDPQQGTPGRSCRVSPLSTASPQEYSVGAGDGMLSGKLPRDRKTRRHDNAEAADSRGWCASVGSAGQAAFGPTSDVVSLRASGICRLVEVEDVVFSWRPYVRVPLCASIVVFFAGTVMAGFAEL